MYPDVCKWFKNFLRRHYKNAMIIVEDTSTKVLSRWLFEKNYHIYFDDYQTYEIQVDIVGLIKERKNTSLAFIECKLKKITLRDISQLLGYSKVAIPSFSIILSPKGVSRSMNLLLNISRRNDILYYTANRHIIIGRWDERKQEVDPSSIIPRGVKLWP